MEPPVQQLSGAAAAAAESAGEVWEKPAQSESGKRSLNRVEELMTKAEVVGATVRVWSIKTENGVQFGPDPRVIGAVERLYATSITIKQIMDAIEALGPDVVAAYEILDSHGNGTVIYPDWK